MNYHGLDSYKATRSVCWLTLPGNPPPFSQLLIPLWSRTAPRCVKVLCNSAIVQPAPGAATMSCWHFKFNSNKSCSKLAPSLQTILPPHLHLCHLPARFCQEYQPNIQLSLKKITQNFFYPPCTFILNMPLFSNSSIQYMNPSQITISHRIRTLLLMGLFPPA